MQRITEKQLESLVERLNKVTNSPLTPYTKQADGKFKANPGNYHWGWAYGGVKLVRMGNEGGGLSDGDVLGTGFGTKREVYNALHSFFRGMEVGENLK